MVRFGLPASKAKFRIRFNNGESKEDTVSGMSCCFSQIFCCHLKRRRKRVCQYISMITPYILGSSSVLKNKAFKRTLRRGLSFLIFSSSPRCFELYRGALQRELWGPLPIPWFWHARRRNPHCDNCVQIYHTHIWVVRPTHCFFCGGDKKTRKHENMSVKSSMHLC